MTRLALVGFALALAASSPVARADAPGAYISLGGVAGDHAYSFAGVAVEGGRRVTGPVFARLRLAGGIATGWEQPGGWFQQTRIGAEVRPCNASGRLCMYAGVDVGLDNARYEHVEGMEDTTLGWVLGARGGVDVAVSPVRVRAGVELQRVIPILSPDGGTGVALDVAMVHAF